ncbi:MAG: DUF2891 domain-containing protein [Prolixibacteraceae bacterium]|jgi:hypothetical protein|nr:DUF2891 domain-containing protein [Prolixibacteraceae bacterium]MBT6005189.1 DUF2891 domain-containing protein [Prolixibacteraceae bacterium]MBT7000877.1 DUF2891 domain-containing protein [Prolixibacteraceae bacterium]MBT7394755.1 DUF2891 domain-containing protein [Prolixibacteraceae bacterium]
MKFKSLLTFIFAIFLLTGNTQEKDFAALLSFDEKKAEYLYHFAFDCIDQEYPNKLGQVLGDESYLSPPRSLHPAFYGCFDWHSSVHGHWTLVAILKEFPDFKYKDEILLKLKKNITKKNILKEIEYFDDEHNKNYERTYGWAWLLKLDEALQDWDSPESMYLHQNLKPLVALISTKFTDFLDKLIYPIRIGEHSNIAFGMSFAYDYAIKYDPVLAAKIKEKAKEYYSSDFDCPLTWEPGGFDFLSPCLQEASLMQKVLSENEFQKWFKKFLPKFAKKPSDFLQVVVVTDRSDGKLTHLDGLNFSRAWGLFELGKALNNKKMNSLAKEHFNYSYEKMDSGEYAGAHWLASFATYALITNEACSKLTVN